MEIENTINFKDNILKIKNNNTNMINNAQNELMESYKINDNFQRIEEALNKAYENIRIMEDIIEYSKEYIKTNIDKSIISCKETINNIEKYSMEITDNIKNYIFTGVKLECGEGPYIDRDGTIIKRSNSYNNTIYFNAIEKPISIIKNINIESDAVNYTNNKNEIKTNSAYRTKYILDRIENNGINEIVTLNFNVPQIINSIQLKLANCKCKYIIYVKENGQEIYSEDLIKHINTTEKINSIKICLNSSNFVTEEIDVVQNNTNELVEKKTVFTDLKNGDEEYEKNRFKLNMLNELKKGGTP